MAARSIATATISFGLVTVPIRVFPATRTSAGLSFHLLHEKDNVRLKQQYVCPKDGEVVPRGEMVKGFEYRKGRYAVFTPEELKALDEQATNGIEIREFVPTDAVDPVFLEKAYYLGPDKGGEKAYALLAEAMGKLDRVAIAQYAVRGKDYLVMLRAADGRLAMHQLFHSDEVREVAEVPQGTRAVREPEVRLAAQLIGQITRESFEPGRYEDQVRKRVQTLIRGKVEGKDITAVPRGRKRGEVVDLMEALKASLARQGGKAPAAARGRRPEARAKRRRASHAARRSAR